MREIIRSILCSSWADQESWAVEEGGARPPVGQNRVPRENATCTGVGGLIVEEGQGKKSRNPLLPQRLQGGVCLASVSPNVPQLIGQQLSGLELLSTGANEMYSHNTAQVPYHTVHIVGQGFSHSITW